MPRRRHQTAALVESRRLRPGRYTASSGRFRAGNARAARAPVVAVDVGDRLFQDDQACPVRARRPPRGTGAAHASSAFSHRRPLRM